MHLLKKIRRGQSSKFCMLVVKAKYEELVAQYPDNYLAIYDVPLDTELNILDHYPSVWIGKEEFE